MVKITPTNKSIDHAPTKYVRLIITENPPNWQRLVETKDNHLEYRVGAGKWKDMTPRKFITFIRSCIQAAKQHPIKFLAIELSRSPFLQLDARDAAWITSTMVENILLADYSFTKYKTSSPSKKELKEVLICGGLNKAAKAGFDRGLVVGTYTNTARDIANTGAHELNPTALGMAARAAIKGTKATVKVLGEAELKKLKMGALLAVGQGSHNESKLIVMEYWGGKKPSKKTAAKKHSTDQPLVLIGKGITYDTGGLYMKPPGSMNDMHMDMSGGSAVIAAVAAAARLGLKKNIIGIIPSAENTVSDRAMRNGDIITTMSGKTVEVVHTDAEGRLVLADGLTYSERYHPRAIIDVATLTGAAMVALGQHASALMSKDEALEAKLRVLGEESGDYVWPLPLWDEYRQHLKSNRADVANIAPNFSKFGGSIEGGIFLSHFVPFNVPWAHIDIAPRMDSIPSDKLAKGSTGEPVRLLIKFLENY